MQKSFNHLNPQISVTIPTLETAMEIEEDIESSCDLIVKQLSDIGFNFLAIDFDWTIIDIHTGGRVSPWLTLMCIYFISLTSFHPVLRHSRIALCAHTTSLSTFYSKVNG